MQLRIFIEPQQGASYDSILAVARATEELGFDGLFRSDHLLAMGSSSGLPGPTEAWTTLAGLARETSRIRLGTLVTAGTFRLPGPLAVTVAQVDQMSGGRVELGLGAGWYPAEHEAYGIPLPPFGERMSRLGEQLEIIHGLWSTPPGEKYSFTGTYYTLSDCPALPKPVQSPHPPIIVGGVGAKRTPLLAARFADEFNVAFVPLQFLEHQYGNVRHACETVGRDPGSLVWSSALVLCCASTEAELRQRADAIGRDVDELRANGAAGTPAEVVDTLRRFRAAGVERMYLQVLDLADMDHLRLVAEEVAPHLGS